MAKPNNELTPMRRQYNDIKEKNQDCILFFRLGDFYEMFDEDAKLAARELDLPLTTRDRNKPKEEQTPMCGVPYILWIPILPVWCRRDIKLPFVSRWRIPPRLRVL